MLILAGLVLLAVLWVLAQPQLIERRRQQLRRQAFPSAWGKILRRRVPYIRGLPANLQIQLKQHILVFIAEKSFVGCAGLTITDEIRVTIAAQACLLILNRRTDYYPNLHQILVYPGAFIVDKLHTDDNGLLLDQRHVLSGESWAHGQVILSWEDTVEGAAVVDDGRNVVIHEFAHQLDQEKGHANGAPILTRRDRYARWSLVLGREFDKLQGQLARQEASLFGDYAASSPAEFFAVVSEIFFEQPQRLAAEYPALYQEFSEFYRMNPLNW